MNRLLRAVGSRRGPLLALAALTLAVVAGTVVLVQLATEAGTSLGWSVAWVLLGAVAIPGTAREVAVGQRREIAVARLRGLRGAGLLSRFLVEPALAVGAGLVVGLAVGAGVLPLLARDWLPGTVTVGAPALLAGAAAAVVAWLVAALTSAPVLLEPLTHQVSGPGRPRRAGAWARAGQVLLLVAAAISVQRAWALAEEGAAVDPGAADPVVLLAPTLVGLAAGQVAVWGLDLLARVGRTVSWHRFGWWLAVRSLTRRAGATGVLRLLVAGGVVAVLALSAVAGVGRWLDDSAALQVVGARQVPVSTTPAQTLALTRDLDPEGRFLMAGVAATSDARPTERRGYLDLSRFEQVVDAEVVTAPVGDPTRLVAEADPATTDGDRVRIDYTASARPPHQSAPGRLERYRLRVLVGYLGADGYPGEQEFVVPLGADLRGSLDRRVGECPRGCQVRSVQVSLHRTQVVGAFGGNVARRLVDALLDEPITLTFARLEVGGVDLTTERWVTAGGMDILADTTYVDRRDDAFRVHLVPYLPPGVREDWGLGVTELELARSRAPLPVLVAGAATIPAAPDPGTVGQGVGERAEQARTPGGRPRPADVRGRAEALPVVGDAGILADLPTALDLDDPAGVNARVFVVAAADTPADLLARVEEAGSDPALTADTVRQRLVSSSGAAQVPGLLALGAAALVVGFLALGAGLGRRRAEEAETVAAFRLLGVDRADVARAGWVESLLVAVAAGVATLLAGVLAVALLLDQLPLVAPPVGSAHLDLGVHWLPAVAVSVGVVAVATLVGRRVRALPEAATRPATLREGGA